MTINRKSAKKVTKNIQNDVIYSKNITNLY